MEKAVKTIRKIHSSKKSQFKDRYSSPGKFDGFDCITANFPYLKGLHEKLDETNTRLLKDDGFLISIEPAGWMLDPLSDVKHHSKKVKIRRSKLNSRLCESYIISKMAASVLFRCKNFDSDFSINSYTKSVGHNIHLTTYSIVQNIIEKIKATITQGNTLSKQIKHLNRCLDDTKAVYEVGLVDRFYYGKPMDYKICKILDNPNYNGKKVLFNTSEERVNFVNAYNHPLMSVIYWLLNVNRHILLTKIPVLALDYNKPINVEKALKSFGLTDDEITYLYKLTSKGFERTYINYAITTNDGRFVVEILPGNHSNDESADNQAYNIIADAGVEASVNKRCFTVLKYTARTINNTYKNLYNGSVAYQTAIFMADSGWWISNIWRGPPVIYNIAS